MYDDLIKQLRYCADATTCRHCPWRSECCLHDAQRKAADAIEVLDMKLQGANAAIAGMQREIERMVIDSVNSKPQWIPVTERLPDAFKHVLVNIPGMTPHPTVQEAFLEKNGMWYSNGFRYSAEEITYWMALPEAPKEKT